jgi:hypothetical protein
LEDRSHIPTTTGGDHTVKTSKYDLKGLQLRRAIRYWHTLEYETQEDLLEWYNVRLNGLDDRQNLPVYGLLGFLHSEGEFFSYTCGFCQAVRVLEGQPQEWSHFQGVKDDQHGSGQLCQDCYGTYEQLKALAGD